MKGRPHRACPNSSTGRTVTNPCWLPGTQVSNHDKSFHLLKALHNCLHNIFFYIRVKIIRKYNLMCTVAATFSISIFYFEGGYPAGSGPDPNDPGGLSRDYCATFPGFSEALCFAFRGDNTGPPNNEQVTSQGCQQWANQ